MSRQMLKNFCIEPTRKSCNCTRDIRCGGIMEVNRWCPEHGERRGGAAEVILRTHFHPIQGQAVGTERQRRYDAAKAS